MKWPFRERRWPDIRAAYSRTCIAASRDAVISGIAMTDDGKEAPEESPAQRRTSPEMRKASLLLSGLMLTPDAALDSFRKRRAADPNLDQQHLRRARDLLDAVAHAITSTEAQPWQRIARAWATLQESPDNLPESPPVEAPSAPDDVVLHDDKPSPPSVAPAPVAASSAAPMPPANKPQIDFQALNHIRLEGDNPGTLPADAALVMRGAALPFQGAADPPPHASAQARRDPLGETRTALHDAPGAPGGQALPFVGATASEDAETSAHPDRVAPGPDSMTRAHDFGVASPAERELVAHLSQITLEQYAALCAECVVNPHWMQQIHARYGVRTPGERSALDQHWQARMGSDDNFANTFRWHYRRYEAWAKSRT